MTEEKLPLPLPIFPRFGGKILETTVRDRLANALHQLLIVGYVRPGQQHCAEHLVRFGEVMQIGARVIARRGASALLIKRVRVFGVKRRPTTPSRALVSSCTRTEPGVTRRDSVACATVFPSSVTLSATLLGPWTGFAVFATEVAALLTVAYLVFRRRDA